MSQWAVYDAVTGRIDRIYSGLAQEAILQPVTGEGVVALPEGMDDVTAFIQSGMVEPQPKQPLNLPESLQITADGDDTAVISGIPPGVKCVWHDGQENIINDGVVELATDLPGTYVLSFDAAPYLRQEVTIEAVPAT